jgi:predicted dienelactone hydrolase
MGVVVWAGLGCASEPDTEKPVDSAETLEPAPEPSDDPSAMGPYSVGVTTFEFTDARGKDLVVEVWYPADVEPGTPPSPYEPTILTASAVRNQPPDLRGAPYPLLGFSHGMAGIRFQSVTLTEHLASHGYVVVSPDHPDNTFLDIDEDAVPRVVLERPDDVRNSIDAFVDLARSDDPHLGGLVDSADEWSILGHSFGAYTALVLGGGQLDYAGVVAYCETNSGQACRYISDLDPSDLEGHGQGDDRIRMTIPYSPGLWYAFGLDGEGLQQVRKPFIFAGDRDDVLEYDTESRPVYERLASPKRLATFHKAGHYPFSDICTLLGPLWEECDPEDTSWADVPEAQVHTNALTTAALEVELRGRTELSEWLEPSHWDGVDMVTLEVE